MPPRQWIALWTGHPQTRPKELRWASASVGALQLWASAMRNSKKRH